MFYDCRSCKYWKVEYFHPEMGVRVSCTKYADSITIEEFIVNLKACAPCWVKHPNIGKGKS